MNERQLRSLIARVGRGTLPRRAFVQRLATFGIGAPAAWALLADAGIAQPSTDPPYRPTRRGGGGPLKLLLWQGPTSLNPHFATGTKDNLGACLFYEPLARWDAEGVLQPILAAEIPSREAGTVAADGRSVVWKLKRGVAWHDGTPFTADDFVFNWQWATDPATAATTLGAFNEMRAEKIDSHTVRLVFDKPTPFWSRPYCTVLLIPKHLFAPYLGSRSREAPNNLKPVGTGAFRFIDFKPGDQLRGEINPAYHQPNKPHFDSVELKGGGDATSAARAVLQTGEYDYAWNLQVEDDVLKRLENGGRGRVVYSPGGALEFVELPWHDPWTEVEGERGHASSRHPVWRDKEARRAMALLLDRRSVQDFVYGRGGIATANVVNNPARFRSPNTRFEFDIDKANALLDAAGWKRGGDGIREKDGRKMRFVYQTSINGARQKVQTIVKQACAKAGIDIELKAVTAAVYFGADVANPDTNSKFWADLQMYTQNMGPPDPVRLMDRYVSWEFATKANKWQGRNISRWRSDEYDRLYRAADTELDAVKRVAMFIRMNDLVCNDFHIHPLVFRPSVAGLGRRLVAPLSGWSDDLTSVASWYRDGA